VVDEEVEESSLIFCHRLNINFANIFRDGKMRRRRRGKGGEGGGGGGATPPTISSEGREGRSGLPFTFRERKFHEAWKNACTKINTKTRVSNISERGGGDEGGERVMTDGAGKRRRRTTNDSSPLLRRNLSVQ